MNLVRVVIMLLLASLPAYNVPYAYQYSYRYRDTHPRMATAACALASQLLLLAAAALHGPILHAGAAEQHMHGAAEHRH